MTTEETYLNKLKFEPIQNPYEASVVYANLALPDGGITVISDGPEIDSDKAQRLAENASKSLELAQKINRDQKLDWLDGSLQINFPKEGSKGQKMLMNEAFDANRVLLDYDDQTQVSTVLHELVEQVEESLPDFKPPSTETLPLFAEFLFSGQSREEFFRNLTRRSLSGEEKGSVGDHDKGWIFALQTLAEKAGIVEDVNNFPADELIEKIEPLRSIDESEKLSLVTSIIDKYTNKK